MGPRNLGLTRSGHTRRPAPIAVVAWLVGSMIPAGCGPGEDVSGGVPASRAAPHVVLRSDPDLARLAESIGARPGVWNAMPGIADSLFMEDSVTVWFVHDLASLDSVGLGAPEPWVTGVAEPSRRHIALRVDGPQRDPGNLLSVYRHEAAHIALHDATGGNAPRWLHEGYAQAASGAWDWNEAWRLQFVLLRGGQGVLENLDRSFRSDFAPRTAYLLSYTAVQTLLDLGGEPGLSALFAELRRGSRMDEALRSVYGLTYGGFEQRWRSSVLDRYGWLYLLSRTAFLWFGVTLLVIGLGIGRVRRDRRRLREMRERERWADLAALADAAEENRD